jgi:hypothetical protein
MQYGSWLRHYGTSQKVKISIPDGLTKLLISLILPAAITTLGLTQPVTEMSTRNLPGVKRGPAHKTDNLTAIYEPIV